MSNRSLGFSATHPSTHHVAFIHHNSWLRTFCLGEVLEQFTDGDITWLVKRDSTIAQLPWPADNIKLNKFNDHRHISCSDCNCPVAERVTYRHGHCDSAAVIASIASKIDETLEYRHDVQVDRQHELDAIIRLAILRNSLGKAIDAAPDIHQLQFLLYQYARALNIIRRVEQIDDADLTFDPNHFTFRHNIEFELVMAVTDLDGPIKSLLATGDLRKLSGLIGAMIAVSRQFSQFYFRCRVLPGCSGFDGSFTPTLDTDLALTRSRVFITRLFVTRFTACFMLMRIKPLSVM